MLSSAAESTEAVRAAHAAKAAAALEDDGFALVPLDPGVDASTLKILKAMLHATDPAQLGRGKDAARGARYDALRLATAWKVDHPRAHAKYESARQCVTEQMALLNARGALQGNCHLKALPLRTAEAAAGLAAVTGKPMVDAANETMLLHVCSRCTPTAFHRAPTVLPSPQRPLRW